MIAATLFLVLASGAITTVLLHNLMRPTTPHEGDEGHELWLRSAALAYIIVTAQVAVIAYNEVLNAWV